MDAKSSPKTKNPRSHWEYRGLLDIFGYLTTCSWRRGGFLSWPRAAPVLASWKIDSPSTLISTPEIYYLINILKMPHWSELSVAILEKNNQFNAGWIFDELIDESDNSDDTSPRQRLLSTRSFQSTTIKMTRHIGDEDYENTNPRLRLAEKYLSSTNEPFK